MYIALHELLAKNNIVIPIPFSISVDTQILWMAEFASQLITNGQSFWKILSEGKISVISVPAKMLTKIFDFYKEHGYVQLISNIDGQHSIKIFNVSLHLGEIAIVFFVTNILNLEEIESLNIIDESPDIGSVELKVEIDIEKSFSTWPDQNKRS